MANTSDDIIQEVVYYDGYPINNMMSRYFPPQQGPSHGGTDITESMGLFNVAPRYGATGGNEFLIQYNNDFAGNGTITTFNNNQSITSKAASTTNSTLSFLKGSSKLLNVVRSGLKIGLGAAGVASVAVGAGATGVAVGAGATGATITNLGLIASETVKGWFQSRTVHNMVTYLTGLGNVGENVGQSIGGIFQDLRAGIHGISGVVTNATNLTSKILRLFSNTVPDSLTSSDITKYTLILMILYYAPGIIGTLANSTNRVVEGITTKIESMLNGGQNQVRVTKRIVYRNGKVPVHFNNNFAATKHSNYISSRKNFRNQLSKQLSKEEINNKLSTYLMEWLATELNNEPQPTLIDILQQVPQQTATILKKIKPNITTEIQENMKHYMLKMRPCDIIDWFYYSMSSQLDNVPENVRRWIYQLPHCDLIEPQPWMRMPLSTLLERPDPEIYKVPENNIPWDKMQEQLKQMLMSDQLSEQQQQMAYQQMQQQML